VNLITVFGVVVLSFMMLMYALERRHAFFLLAFAAGCALSSVYGFVSGAWPFGVVGARSRGGRKTYAQESGG
jgi:hypothetical protein